MIENDLKKYQLATLGYFGAFSVLGGQTATSSSHIWHIKAVSDITVNTVAIGGSDLVAIPIPAGDVLFGNWKSVTITGGDAIVYDLSGHVVVV